MLCEVRAPDNVALPEVSPWESLAQDGRLEEAIVSYCRRYDDVLLPELQRVLAPYMPTAGDVALVLCHTCNLG